MQTVQKVNVMVIGSGGREHALAWKLAQSPRIGQLYAAPGNAGTATLAINVPLGYADPATLIEFARTHDVGLVVVAPDDALAAGLVDTLDAAGIRAFGPTAAAAQIESSKAFAKKLMDTTGVPTARYQTFTDLAAARRYAADCRYPLVVKASGLALGKGVVICATALEASQALTEMMSRGSFGEAGRTVIIEEFLDGEEISTHAFSDGRTAVMFPSAQDHKQIYDGDKGANTGGMGTYAPVPWAGPELIEDARSTVVEPILAALAKQGAPFRGLLYPGLMLRGGQSKVLEVNARFGDPEIQTYLRLLKTDLLDILEACIDGTLADVPVTWSDQTAVTVVMASAGYPAKAHTGRPITGLAAAAALPGIQIFHAGTKLADGAHPTDADPRYVTSGGRVLGVSAVGSDLAEARARAYAAVKLIHFAGAQYRSDIGARPRA